MFALISACSSGEETSQLQNSGNSTAPALGAASAQVTTVTTSSETDVLLVPSTGLTDVAQAQTTQSPENTTQSPENTSQSPENTTQSPENTTQSPENTSQSPESSTQPPANPFDLAQTSSPGNGPENDNEDPDLEEANPETNSTSIIKITWQVASANDLGHYIYFAKNSGNTYQLATQRLLSGEETNGEVQHTFDAGTDLGLGASESVCFAISAFDDDGESGRSASECVTLTK